ncbi:response regulator [Bradyrhizobium sp. th.b2]|uniref:response regulator n=1 Tax=Bradyrhizobium sp. th-b2 TaxID=172088 RepID=UPI00040F3C01|nr:response regulator [Bradyrhizobium sp. th.b2]
MANETKHLVITVHGIRTFGQWQQRLEKVVNNKNGAIQFNHFQFGYFSILAFIIPFTRWLLVRRFRRELRAVVSRHSPTRLDLVGHSFGTHLIAWALRGLGDGEKIQIHTLILAGSVLRADHYWADLIPSRVGRVINDCGVRDSVLLASQFCVPFTGMAGRTGFVGMNGSEFLNRYSMFGHSGYFQNENRDPSDEYMVSNWSPLISSDAPAVPFDAREVPTPWRGLIIWLSNNFEPIKLSILTAPLLIFAIVVGALYVRANATNERLAAVAALAQQMKYKNSFPREAEPLLETIQRALASSLERTAVLWVDDDPSANSFEQRALTKFGLCFAQVGNTDEAIRMLEANPSRFSVVLSDFARPKDTKAGYGLLEEMTKRKINVPLIFYVTRVNEDQLKEALNRGVRAEVTGSIDLLTEVIDLLPPQSKIPGRLELISQMLLGCWGMWSQPSK